MFLWQIRLLFARTVITNLFLQKVNRLFIRKRASRMNHKGARIAEKQENSKEGIITTVHEDMVKIGRMPILS